MIGNRVSDHSRLYNEFLLSEFELIHSLNTKLLYNDYFT